MPIAKFVTDADIEVKNFYTAADLPSNSRFEEIPGEFPFTRGIYSDMYRSRLWTMRQYGGYATAAETNARFRYLLSQGQTGLSVAFDLPTQMGYDSDHALAEGEVGKVGVAISSLEDMQVLFDGIRLQDITTSMTINATAPILLALYIAIAKKQGADLREIGGTVQNDILKEYIARATYIYPPAGSMRLVTDLFEYCTASAAMEFHFHQRLSHSRSWVGRSAGSGVCVCKCHGDVAAAIQRGLNVDAFGQRLSFFFNSHNNFFEEIAKFRAARRLWACIMKEKFGAQNPRAMMLRFHAQTAGSTLTAQQPNNNVVRVALQTLAAVLGGTQSLHTNSRDEALALPSEDSVRIALRTQQIIAHESGVAATADPLAGSYFVEWLTNEIETGVRKYLDQIEAMGGAPRHRERIFPAGNCAARV
jgi:methylmalonyl-CoA mutase N-terminal domain/subunit